MQTDQLTQIITELARKALGRQDVGPDDDFFDLGANSLTVVDLQIQIESRLGRQAPTSALMEAPSVNGWADAYRSATEAAEPADAEAAQ